MSGHDDQRDAVADAARGDLLAEPHQENRAAGQRDNGRQAKCQAGRDDNVPHCSSPMAMRIGLHGGEHHRAVARVLVDLLASGLAFLLQLFEGGRNRRHQLNDDGGGDVGHDAECEDRHAPNRAAGQHVEDIEQAALLLLDLTRKFRRIDPRHRDIGPEPRDDQGHHREQDALLKLRRLRQGREIEIGC